MKAINLAKISVLTLGIALAVMPDVVFAQVFSPKMQKAPVQNSATSASTNRVNLKQNNAASVPANRATAAQNNAQQASKATVQPAKAEVKKNFSGVTAEPKYDNATPKIVSFKIVNGEVIVDKEKERSILVYYDDYQVHRGLDDYVRCSMRVYVLNDLTEKISSLGFKLYWPEISTSVQMEQINPGVRTYKDIMLMGDGCFAIDKAPTIEVNRCRAKNISQDKCADAIKWYEKPKS